MKRFLALFLAVCLCFGCVPATHVHAEEVEGDPQAENSWRYEDGELLEESDVLADVEESVEAPSVYAFYPSEKKALGIDVSEHQGSINWTNVKNAGIQFAIIRCGYGQNQSSQDDDYFLQNIKGANDAGIPFGLYLYNYAKTTSGASGEADHAIRLINVAKQYSQFKLPMYYDLEENSVYALSNATVLAMAKTFHDRVEAATGWPVGVYANTSWFNNKLTDSWYQSQPLWVAQYNTSCQYNGKYDIWQYSSSGSVNGISGRVDMNYARVPVSTLCSYTTSGTVAAPETKITTNKSSYSSGEAIVVDAYCNQTSSWFGIFPASATSNEGTSLFWFNLKDSSGTDQYNSYPVNVFDAVTKTANRGYNWNSTYQYDNTGNDGSVFWGDLKPGNYEIRIVSSNYATLAKKAITVTAANTTTSLSTDKTTYTRVGNTVDRVMVTVNCAEPRSWVGIFKDGADPLKDTSLAWFYCYNNNGYPISIFDQSWQGAWPDDITTGKYNVVLLNAARTKALKTVTVTFTAPSVSANKSTYCVNQDIYVSTVYAEDGWVGLYKDGEEYGTGGVTSLYWYYLSEGGRSNTNIFGFHRERPGDYSAATYNIILFEGEGYTELAKTTVTVVKCTDGNKDHKCDYCGTTLSSCNSDGKSGDQASPATCTSAATYYKECSVCGKNSTATYSSGSSLGHNYTEKLADASHLKNAATCTKPAEYYYDCSRCSKSSKGDTNATFTSGSTASHNQNGTSTDIKYLASKATCTSSAVYYKSCSACGHYSLTNATFTSGGTDSSAHTQGTHYVQKNATQHDVKYLCCGAVANTEGHEWSNGTCSECGYVCTHTGGTATCTAKPVCTNCGVSYGSVNATNHTGSASWTTKDENQHESKYSCCGVTAVTLENHEWADGVCAECGYTCEHVDENEKDHICDTCSKVLDACKDEDNNNKCDYCGATMCEHEGGKADCQNSAICSKCGKPYGTTDPSNHTGAPEWTKTNDTHKQAYSCCGAVIVEEDSHVDEDEADHKCDICDKDLGDCSDKTGDGDHKCDVCGKDNINDCADKADDKDHKCDECGKDNINECVDTDPADHKCDICDKDLGDCSDKTGDEDHKCDVCGEEGITDCSDKTGDEDHKCDECGKDNITDCADKADDKDHKCDECGKDNMNDCVDTDPADHKCDICDKVLGQCKDENNDNKCDHCGDTMCEHKDEDKDHNCDLCEKPLSDCQDENKDHKCDTCDKTLSECKDEDKDYKCDICGKDLDKPVPEVGSDRLAGKDRFDTAFIVADQLKKELGVEKFNAIIVASGLDFADALSGSYLAAVKNAPILLSFKDKQNQQVMEYIRENLAEDGIVYILGGPVAVPDSMDKAMSDLNVKRLAGENRFDTNTEILKEVGVPSGETVLVCTGTDFADCLSGSATAKPIMLVYKRLMDSQKEFLPTLDNEFCIIGGQNAVNKDIEATLKTFGDTERLAGAHRYETSVMVAETFFEAPVSVVLAYAKNYPDGLCGGALAVAQGAPLLLTDSKYYSFAAEYTKANGILSGIVLGGDKLISQAAVEAILGE